MEPCPADGMADDIGAADLPSPILAGTAARVDLAHVLAFCGVGDTWDGGQSVVFRYGSETHQCGARGVDCRDDAVVCVWAVLCDGAGEVSAEEVDWHGCSALRDRAAAIEDVWRCVAIGRWSGVVGLSDVYGVYCVLKAAEWEVEPDWNGNVELSWGSGAADAGNDYAVARFSVSAVAADFLALPFVYGGGTERVLFPDLLSRPETNAGIAVDHLYLPATGDGIGDGHTATG